MPFTKTTIHSVKRMKNSANGNPRFTVMTDHGQMVTAPDSTVNYDLMNVEHKPTPLNLAVKIHLDRQHRITDIKEIQ